MYITYSYIVRAYIMLFLSDASDYPQVLYIHS